MMWNMGHMANSPPIPGASSCVCLYIVYCACLCLVWPNNLQKMIKTQAYSWHFLHWIGYYYYYYLFRQQLYIDVWLLVALLISVTLYPIVTTERFHAVAGKKINRLQSSQGTCKDGIMLSMWWLNREQEKLIDYNVGSG